jgi:hypothetical protein
MVTLLGIRVNYHSVLFSYLWVTLRTPSIVLFSRGEIKEGKWKGRRNGHGCRGIVEEECKRKSNNTVS